MDTFNIGDKVIYDPVGVNKPDWERPGDHGIVTSKLYGTHLVVYIKYWQRYSTIYHTAVRHLNAKVHRIELHVPSGTIDIITYEELKDGDIIVDFLRTETEYESKFNTYYLESTFNILTKNPFTNKPIDKSSIIKYICKII
jgi:hypothetical protein